MVENSGLISVSLVEDDADLGKHLAWLLRGAPDIKLLDVYTSATAAVDGISRRPPDVTVMDINLPDGSGVTCVERLKSANPNIQFLMLTVYEDGESIFNSLRAGASGYLLKRSAP